MLEEADEMIESIPSKRASQMPYLSKLVMDDAEDEPRRGSNPGLLSLFCTINLKRGTDTWSATNAEFAKKLCTSSKNELAIFDLTFSFVGIIGWLGVSLLWEDRALILLNGVGFIILFSGLIKYFFVV